MTSSTHRKGGDFYTHTHIYIQNPIIIIITNKFINKYESKRGGLGQKRKKKKIPQILMGASSSNKLGCCKKITLETTQS